MPYKYISTYYPTGYTLAAKYSDLVIEASGAVGGTGVSTSAYAGVYNSGRIKSTYSPGVTLVDGGIVKNKRDGTIIAGLGGYSKAACTVVNYGTIIASNDPVFITGGGRVVNGSAYVTTAFIGGARIRITANPGTVPNFSTIEAGVYLDEGGLVTNGSAQDSLARIVGRVGVFLSGAGVVDNFGTIAASASSGVELFVGGTVLNGGLTDSQATILGTVGVRVAAAATVTNFGTIAGRLASHFGAGVVLYSGDTLTNGSRNDTRALIDGYYGVKAQGAASLIANYGTIAGDGDLGAGIILAADGVVINGSNVDRSAVISGDSGVVGKAGVITVTNFATILGTGHFGLQLYGTVGVVNGSVSDQSALIEGYQGIGAKGASITNYGTVLGFGGAAYSAVALGDGSRLINGSASDTHALLSGGEGVRTFGANTTVTNFGTIVGTGGIAVELSSATDALAVAAGAVFVGKVSGNQSGLELVNGVGTLTNLFVGGNVTVSGSMAATTFGNFGRLIIDPGASFTLSGNATIAASQSLSALGFLSVAGKLTSAGSLTTAGTLAGTGTLALVGGAAVFKSGTSLAIAHITESGATTKASASSSLSYAGQFSQTSGTVAAGAGVVLTFAGGANSFAGTFSGGGTIAFKGGADALTGTTFAAAFGQITNAAVTLNGTVTNSGSIGVSSPSLVVAASGATLKGGGAFNLSNLATNKITGASAAATLTNVDNKILGAGQLGAGSLTLINGSAGLINGDRPTALIIDTGVNTVANGGIIENSSTGGTTLSGAVNNTGTLLAAAGTLLVKGAVTGAGTVRITAGTASLGSTFTENVSFLAGSTGTLTLAKSTTYTGAISGFSKTATTKLDLLDIAFTGSTKATFSGTAASGTLTVTDGTHTAKIKLVGDYTASTFVVANDGAGHTLVHDPAKTLAAPPTRLPPHHFAAAMAGHAARVAAMLETTQHPWRHSAPTLARP